MTTTSSDSPQKDRPPFAWGQALVYAFTGALAMLLIVSSIWILIQPSPTPKSTVVRNTTGGLRAQKDHGPYIAQVASNAYGVITPGSASLKTGGGGEGSAGPAAMMDVSSSQDDEKKISAPEPSVMPPSPPYEVTRYKYMYQRELTLPGTQVDVYRLRQGGIASDSTSFSDNITSLLSKTDSLKNLMLQTLSVNEDRDYGYSFSLDTSSGVLSLSVYKNWLKWPNPYDACARTADSNCYDNLRIRLSDVPSDEVALRLADEFVKQYGIDVSKFGTPVVDQQWKQWLTGTSEDQQWGPEEITVLYPLMINDQSVWEEWGTLTGLRIGIDVREKKVSSASPIVEQLYEASKYDVADIEKIKKAVENGSRTTPYYSEPGSGVEEKIVEVKLGDPKNVLVSIWHYDEKTKMSEQIYVPAFQFPIIEKPANDPYFYQEYVTIPLVKDLFEEVPPSVFPLMKSSGMGGSGVSGVAPVLPPEEPMKGDTPKGE